MRAVLLFLVSFVLSLPLHGGSPEGTCVPACRVKSEFASPGLLVPRTKKARGDERKDSLLQTEIEMDRVRSTTERVSYKEILPDVTTPVILSSLDVNRLVCSGKVTDVVFSKEKGVKVRVIGKNIFVKFTAVKLERGRGQVVEREEVKYPSKPVDIYVVCGGRVYSIVAYPRKVPPVTLILSEGERDKIRKNMELFSKKSFAGFLVEMVKDAYTDRIPSSFTVRELSTAISMKQGILRGVREIDAEGTGLSLKEFVFIPKKAGRVEEKDFLRPEITKNPVAVSLDSLTFGPGQKIRVFVIERRE